MPKIKLRRGLENNLPRFDEGELGFTKDTKRVFVGSDTGNVELAKKETVDLVQTDLQNNINQVDTKANDAISKAQSVQDEFNRVIAEAGSNNPEVVQARGAEVNLNARLDKFSSSLAQKASKDKNVFKGETYGTFNNANVLAAIGNESENAQAQVMGVSTAAQAAQYFARDTAALYVSNAGKNPTLTVSTGTATINYSGTGLQVIGDIDFSKLKPSMIVDTLHNPVCCGIIKEINLDTKTITLVDGWAEVGGDGSSVIPINDIGFKVDQITKTWGINNNVFLYPDDETAQGVAEEIGLFNGKYENGDLGGIDLVNFEGQANFGFKTRGKDNGFDYAFLSEQAINHFTAKSTSGGENLLRSDLNGDTNLGFLLSANGTQSKLRLNLNIYPDGANQYSDEKQRIFIINHSTGTTFRLPSPKGKAGEFIFVLNIGASWTTLAIINDDGFINTGVSGLSTGIQSKASMVLVSDGNSWHVLNTNIGTTMISSAPPSNVPNYVGQEFMDTTNKRLYKAFGTNSSADWVAMN